MVQRIRSSIFEASSFEKINKKYNNEFILNYKILFPGLFYCNLSKNNVDNNIFQKTLLQTIKL